MRSRIYVAAHSASLRPADPAGVGGKSVALAKRREIMHNLRDAIRRPRYEYPLYLRYHYIAALLQWAPRSSHCRNHTLLQRDDQNYGADNSSGKFLTWRILSFMAAAN